MVRSKFALDFRHVADLVWLITQLNGLEYKCSKIILLTIKSTNTKL